MSRLRHAASGGRGTRPGFHCSPEVPAMLRIFFPSLNSQRLFFALLGLLLLAETVWTQTMTQQDKVLRDRIAAVRQKIDTAARWHGTDDQLGGLWHRLATDYQDEGDLQRSEEAFTRSLKLLRNSPEQKHYAAALDDLASFYLATGRGKEAENCEN